MSKRKSDSYDECIKRIATDDRKEISSYDRRIAFLMATHPRLGASSSAKVLLPELFKAICNYITQPYILVIGGAYVYRETHRIGLRDSLRNCDRFDITHKKWKQMNSLPNSRAGLGAVNLNGNIYLLGGCKNKEWERTPLDTVEIFNPITQAYSSGPSMSNPRSNFGSCVMNNKIFVFGGYCLVNCEMFHNNKWTPIAPLRSVRTSVIATAFDTNKILLLSSAKSLCSSIFLLFSHFLIIFECQSKQPDFSATFEGCHCVCVICEVYNIENDTYEEIAHPCASLSEVSLGRVGNKFYCVGGFEQPEHYWFGGCSTSNESSDRVFEYCMDRKTWRAVADLPESLGSSATIGYESQLYVFGGGSGSEYPGYESSQHCYQYDGDAWLKMPSMVTDRLDSAVVLYYD